MVDMGQADRSLRSTAQSDRERDDALNQQRRYQRALAPAAEQMGFRHFIEVPDDRVEELQALARDIAEAGADETRETRKKTPGMR